MRIRKEFILHNADGEAVLVPTGEAEFSGIVRGNKTLGDILSCLEKETNESEIIKELKEKYDAPEGAIEKDVKYVLAELRRIDALDE